MSRQTTAAFLADCLKHMPPQPQQVKRAIDTVVDGLKLIADGGDWPREAAAWAADWAAAWAASRAAWAASEAAAWAASEAADRATWAADWAARAHPDPAKERSRQATVRKEIGL